MSNATLTAGDLETILREHRIPEGEWPEWAALVYDHQRPPESLRVRMWGRGKRGDAFKHILTALSRNCKHKFPPQKVSGNRTVRPRRGGR